MRAFATQLQDGASRRHFIQTAATAFLGVTAAPRLATAAPGENTAADRQVPTARNVIYLYMTGGMSHLDTWDPKPKSGVTGLTKAIRTSVDDLQISDNLPLMARRMHQVALVRSMNSTQGAHEQGQYFMRTSYTLRSSIRHPSMGAWLEKFQGRGNPTLPATVMIGNESRHPGAGFFEARHAPLMINNPEGGLKNISRLQRFDQDAFTGRLQLSEQLDAAFSSRYDLSRVRAYTDMYEDAVKMMNSEELAAFDLSAEPDRLRERYGRGRFGQGCLLARRLVEHGVRFVEVTFGNWDTHNANFTRVPELCDELDSALSTLISDLEKRGLLDDTLVVLATEFGRTPVINANDGRDHHPKAFSCLLAGGGVKGGSVHGSTDENGDAVAASAVNVQDFNATIGYALGLPLDQVLFSPSKRPFTVADKGRPLTHLFA